MERLGEECRSWHKDRVTCVKEVDEMMNGSSADNLPRGCKSTTPYSCLRALSSVGKNLSDACSSTPFYKSVVSTKGSSRDFVKSDSMRGSKWAKDHGLHGEVGDFSQKTKRDL